MLYFARGFCRHGRRVSVPDLPGSGRTPGRFSCFAPSRMEQMREAGLSARTLSAWMDHADPHIRRLGNSDWGLGAVVGDVCVGNLRRAPLCRLLFGFHPCRVLGRFLILGSTSDLPASMRSVAPYATQLTPAEKSCSSNRTIRPPP